MKKILTTVQFSGTAEQEKQLDIGLGGAVQGSKSGGRQGSNPRPVVDFHIHMLSDYIHLIDQPLCSTELVNDEEDIADIDIDTSLEIRLEHYVAAH